MHISKLLPHVNLFSQVQGTIHNSMHWYVLFRFWLFCFLLLFLLFCLLFVAVVVVVVVVVVIVVCWLFRECSAKALKSHGKFSRMPHVLKNLSARDSNFKAENFIIFIP